MNCCFIGNLKGYLKDFIASCGKLKTYEILVETLRTINNSYPILGPTMCNIEE